MALRLSKRIAKRMRGAQLEAYRRLSIVSTPSPYDAIYYCCTQKTASQWFKAVLSDPISFRHTGLSVVPYSEKIELKKAFPPGSIATHLYIDRSTYDAIPKPSSYRTFFVLRDPRDIVTSWYFSTKFSHHPYPQVVRRRGVLEGLELQDGLRYSIDELFDEGLFDVQRSWVDHNDDNAKLFRYEDFAADNEQFLKDLFTYLNIRMPQKRFERLTARHRFERYAGNRAQGEHNRFSHYRKGVPGDWVNFFDAETISYFDAKTGDLLNVLGYAE